MRAGTETHRCAPASAVSQIRSLPVGKRWCGSKNKLSQAPRESERFLVSHFDLMGEEALTCTI